MINYNYLNALNYYLQWRSHPQTSGSGVLSVQSVNLDEVVLLADFLNENEGYNNYAYSALSLACSYAPSNAHVQDILSASNKFLEFINTETPVGLAETYKGKDFMGVKNALEVAKVKPSKD